ncbi:MAG: hypothetical protein LBM93_08675 [Oscillospiraceae bacterium]|jgi:hypothetical protein|nr:hypothetical protein [Oscillospiraceae bacterium]
MFETIKLEKSMYNLSGKSFTQALESLDPSDNYIGTPYEGMDAYERQLKRFDIKVSGADCDKVDKFFATTESAVLFPEFVKRCISEGISGTVLEDVFAVKTKINSRYYNGVIATDDGVWDTNIGQGEAFNTTTIKEGSSGIALKKYGRTIKTSYEFLRTQNLDLLGVLLRNVGRRIGVTAFYNSIKDICGSLEFDTTDYNTYQYQDLVDIYNGFNNFSLTGILVAPEVLGQISTLTELADYTVTETGRLKLPFGTELIPVKGLGNSDGIIGFDKSFAFEFVQSGDVIVDVDKLIDAQMDVINTSITVAGKCLNTDAVKYVKHGTAFYE